MRALVERFLRAAGWMPVSEAVEQSQVSSSLVALGVGADEGHEVVEIALTVARLGYTATDVAELVADDLAGRSGRRGR